MSLPDVQAEYLPRFTVSIVSHGHVKYLKCLLGDLRTWSGVDLEIVLTFNIPEDESFLRCFEDLKIKVIRNVKPLGFGRNHNNAFLISSGQYFVVVNPDIRAPDLDFLEIPQIFFDRFFGAWSPRVIGSSGNAEDHARKFPTVFSLLRRRFSKKIELDYPLFNVPYCVDWLAGMFMVFSRASFNIVGGFDEKYFLYVEDVDICKRLRSFGLSSWVDPRFQVVHFAQRASTRSLRHFVWHARGMARFFMKDFRLIQ